MVDGPASNGWSGSESLSDVILTRSDGVKLWATTLRWETEMPLCQELFGEGVKVKGQVHGPSRSIWRAH